MDTEDRVASALAAALKSEPERWTPDCLPPERILALAERALPEPEAARLMAHAALCARCRREYAETVELLQLAEEARSEGPLAVRTTDSAPAARREPARRPPFWQRWLLPGAGFAMGVAAVGLAVALLYAAPVQTQRNRLASALRERDTRLARVEGEKAALGQELAAVKQQSQGQASQLAAEVSRLKAREKAQGVRMARLEQDAAVLQQAPLPMPEWLVSQEIGRVRGAGGEAGPAPQIRLLHPVNTAVWDPRPILECRPVAGASGYQVSLEMAGSNEEVPAPKALSQVRWQVTAPLRPGRVYQWAVTAQRKGQSLRSPMEKFYVLGEAERREVETARKQYAKNPLALGAVYARLGLLPEAEQQLREAVKADPGQPVASRWLAQIEKRSGGT